MTDYMHMLGEDETAGKRQVFLAENKVPPESAFCSVTL